MSRYDYKCQSCGNVVELERPCDWELELCLKCGGTSIKQFPLTNFHLKGSGWAADNYSRKAARSGIKDDN